MAVISNLNSKQTPITTGVTGTQVIKFIDCPRVYVKAVDATPTPVATKSNGVLPVGWTDLGVVDGKVRIAYEKERKEVRTGVDNILRATYSGQKSASFEFVLSQFDDVVIKELSGLAGSVISAGSCVEFPIGQEDIITRALLLVVQNKIDGKEWQFYHPSAYVSFTIEDSGEFTVVRGRGDLPGFVYGSVETLMVARIFA